MKKIMAILIIGIIPFQQFLPEMIDFVRENDVIVVKWDGYVEAVGE